MNKRESEAHGDMMPSLTFTFTLFQVEVAYEKLLKRCWVRNPMPCICTLLAFPGMTWAQEKMRQEAKEGKKPSLRSGAFCPTPPPQTSSSAEWWSERNVMEGTKLSGIL